MTAAGQFLTYTDGQGRTGTPQNLPFAPDNCYFENGHNQT